MNSELAKEILSKIAALDDPLNKVAAMIEVIDDHEERKLFRRAVASVAGLIYTDLIVEIQKRFPDLKLSSD